MFAPVHAHLLAMLVAAGAGAATLTGCDDGKTTHVFVVRHAEKRLDQGRDPELSEAGRERARALAHALEHVRMDAVFATEYRRTQHTVAAIAERDDLEVQVVDAAGTDALAAQILRRHRGQTVLVSAHSNTIGALITALGGPHVGELGEDDYDGLFLLSRSRRRATFFRLGYGADAR
jgi:broad specificity phosphatase PhoE